MDQKGEIMENKESAKVTGISDLTGKVIRVRHAAEADMAFIEEQMKKYRFDTNNLSYGDFAVATENGDIIGFGRLKKTSDIYEVGCIVVMENRRGKGIGRMILDHLLEFTPVDKVYVMTDWVDYFKKLGFAELKSSKEQTHIFNLLCNKGEGKKVLMSYDKTDR